MEVTAVILLSLALLLVLVEYVLRRRRDQMLKTRANKLHVMEDRIDAAFESLDLLRFHNGLERFDNGLPAFLAHARPKAVFAADELKRFQGQYFWTAIGLYLSNRRLDRVYRSAREFEVEFGARANQVEREMMRWANVQVTGVLGQVQATEQWVETLEEPQVRNEYMRLLYDVSDAVMNAFEELQAAPNRIRDPSLLLVLEGAMARAQTVTDTICGDVDDNSQETPIKPVGRRA